MVLTGGSSLIEGMIELGEDVFFRQVRIASPSYSGNLMDIVCNPRYSTAMGLLFEANNQNEISKNSNIQTATLLDVFKKMKSWFVGNF